MFKDKVLYILYRLFSGLKPVNFFVSGLYKYVLIPSITTLLKMRHPCLLDIVPRNSLLSIKNFEAFLSDIDLTLVVKDSFDTQDLIRDFAKIKKLLVMLDMPEIYSFSEMEQLLFFKKQSYWKLIENLYKIRKISWSLESMKRNTSPINKIKQRRAINNSLQAIRKNYPHHSSDHYNLSDFKYLEDFVAIDDDYKSICYYSPFLGINLKDKFVIELSEKEFVIFNALLPGEVVNKKVATFVSDDFLACKIAIDYYELYLSRSVQRIRSAQNLSTDNWDAWIESLERNLKIN